MKIDRNEECGFCGMPRHAHWGGPQAPAAGRCAGFQSTAETKMRAAAPEMLAALKAGLAQIDAYLLATVHVTGIEPSRRALIAAGDEMYAASAKAEGRDDD